MKTPVVISFILILQYCYAPPVTQNQKKNETHNGQDSEVYGLEDYMEYHRYLKEVVNALESDPDFKTKLEKAEEDDIRSGKIADELEFVSHHVRTRLDEIKRVELQRLKELTEKKRRLENSIDDDPIHHHLDHSNPHTFEIEDLKKLIAKTTQDLAEADRKRKEEFKQYELEKEYKKIDKLNHTNGSEREKLEKEYKEMEQKHKNHEKLHEPGHKAQLEEVWEEQDQMQQDFDPKTFFLLHDLDGNGLWDQEEVKALFIKELNKMYEQGATEDDMRERSEEMERMRESVFKEMDTNRDGFIDYNEFIRQTQSNEFKQDHGWQGIDEQKPYTDEELAEYIRQHELANQIPHGQPMYQVPPGAGYQVPPGGGYQQVPQGYQVPPAGYQQAPHGGYYANAIPPPQGQFQPGQVPQHPPQQVPGHIPQNQLNTNEVYPNQQQVYQQQGYPQQGHQQQAGQVNYQNQQGNYQNPQGNYQQQQPSPQQPANVPQNVQQPPQQQQQQQPVYNNQPPQQQINQQQQVNNQQPVQNSQQIPQQVPQQQVNQQQNQPNVQQVNPQQVAPHS